MNDKFEGFEPANTTPVPDVLFDELLSKLSGAELKVLLYIIRRTLGFKKEADAISLSQLEKGIITRDGKQLDRGCGLHRETVSKALTTLEQKGCIKRLKDKTSQGDDATTVYSIHFKQKVVGKSDHVGSRKIRPLVVGNNDYGSSENRLPLVGKSDPQETVIQLDSLQETEQQERAFTSVHAPLAPVDVLPGAQNGNDAQTSRPVAVHDPLPGSGSDAHALLGATPDVEEDAPTAHRIPAIKLNGAPNGQLNTLTASASIPGEPENSPLSVHSPHSLQGIDGAATTGGSEPRASGKQDKPKRRKKPVEVQLTLDAARLKEWYDELRGLSTSLSKRNVDSWESLTQKKGNDDRDMFLNIVALLDIDPWFEEHKIAVDAYWINRSWENKYIFLRGHKNVPLADKKPMDVYTAASLDPERNKRNLERLKANRLAKEAAQGVNHHGTN